MQLLQVIRHLVQSSLAVFTINDLSRILRKPKNYCSLYLHRLKKKEHILQVEKGKYALNDTNIYAIASNLIPHSYVSFLSALSYYKLTTQLPQTIHVVAPKSKKPIYFQGYNLHFVKMNPSKIFSITKQYSGGKNLFIGTKEKVIIDSIYLPRYCPLSETYDALKEAKLGLNELLRTALKMHSFVLMKRLGYLLEKEGINLSRKIKLNKTYDRLNPFTPGKGRRNDKWKLIVNEEI